MSSTLLRSKAIAKNAIAGGGAQAASILAQLLIVRLSVEHLGTREFGIWMSINSVLAILVISDLGLGGALIRMTARSRDEGGLYLLKPIARSALKFMSVVGLVLVATTFLITSEINGRTVLGMSSMANTDDLVLTARLLVSLFSINMVAQIAVPLRLGTLTGHVNGMFQTAGHIANLMFVVIAIWSGATLPILAAAAISGTTLFNLINLMTLWLSIRGTEDQALAPPLSAILRPSLPFFVLGVLGALSYNIDNLIIARWLDVGQVSQNAIAQRIFNLPIAVLSLFYIGLWASYSDAEGGNDYAWIRTAYVRTLKAAVTAAICAAIGLYASFGPLSQLIAGEYVEFDPLLVISFAAWVPIVALSGATASLMNGLHLLKPQIAAATAALAINLFLSVALVRTIGVAGPILGTVISLAITQPALAVFCLKHLDHRSGQDTDVPERNGP